ncbi:FecR family protein [Rhabdobacter roseus]|uniref:Ferric-dicitrate binding protein FerR (Iron transport regulator) n=1 Tax=Rhabdobacter roseus TaxID=1655419 RepID=A0A840TQ75_9BACT|nr:FecR family protein [Rhabdobacter roseus]MBB5285484.1 ferric-dicitrate binding protein FerR (iron transport regulator) [Rhabdobacter roseus]
MFNYAFYTAEEFLKDEWFREWVLSPSPQSEDFWNEWLRLNPEKQATVDQARAWLRVLEMPHQQVSKAEMDEAIDETWSLIQQRQAPAGRVMSLRAWSRVAAAAMVVLGLSWAWFLYENRSPSQPSTSQAATQPQGLITITNNEPKARLVQLPDGSRITLEPLASVNYPKEFGEAERRIYLKGNAFFEVAHNPAKPFWVLTEKLVTRVLGTSFWIEADAGRPESRVIVKTGKVSVFRTADLRQQASNKEGVVLTPNQQVRLLTEGQRLAKSLVEEPVVVQPMDDSPEFNYVEAPASQIFRDLSQAYGIELVYDEQVLKHCQITATLGSETFAEKLDLLCRSIHSSYEIIETQVVIYSKGCK